MKVELKISDGKNLSDSDVYVEIRGGPLLVEAVKKAIQNFVDASENLRIY